MIGVVGVVLGRGRGLHLVDGRGPVAGLQHGPDGALDRPLRSRRRLRPAAGRPTASWTSTGSPPSDRRRDTGRLAFRDRQRSRLRATRRPRRARRRAGPGTGQALETLLVGHYDRVHALCRRMLGNEADAVDAAQDALLSAVRSIARFDGRSSFGTWLYRIATNACLDELRRRRRRPRRRAPRRRWTTTGTVPGPAHARRRAAGRR